MLVETLTEVESTDGETSTEDGSGVTPIASGSGTSLSARSGATKGIEDDKGCSTRSSGGKEKATLGSSTQADMIQRTKMGVTAAIMNSSTLPS